jgi:hypothetical protein
LRTDMRLLVRVGQTYSTQPAAGGCKRHTTRVHPPE